MREPSIVPLPQSYTGRAGQFVVDSSTSIAAESASNACSQFLGQLSRVTGCDLTRSAEPDAKRILFTIDAGSSPPESYVIDVSEAELVVTAADDAGLFYAVQSLRQLLPLEVDSADNCVRRDWSLPCGRIVDAPRFPWRGCLLDCSRHFRSMAFIRRFIDLLALYRMNRFHWHLTDDQGWRVEMDCFPALTNTGAWRTEPDGSRHGGFYSKAEIREIVAYAAERHVMVIPEIDMPGHTAAIVAAIPELSCHKERIDVPSRFGSNENVVCGGSEETYRFAAAVLSEVAELFPAPYIHIGGDECLKGFWEKCPVCQKRIVDENLDDEKGLEQYFIGRLEEIVSSLGKRLIGWDEIFELESEGIGHEVAVTYPASADEDKLRPDTVVQSWRHPEGAKRAARCGHNTIVSTESNLYISYPYRKTPTQKVYDFEPGFADLSFDSLPNILGIETCLWAESFKTDAIVENFAFPRLLAAAEIAWTAPERKDWCGFSQRLLRETKRLLALDLAANPDFGIAELWFDFPEATGEEGEVSFHIENRAAEPVQIAVDSTDTRLDLRQLAETVGAEESIEIRVCYTAPLAERTKWALTYANPVGDDIVLRRALNVMPQEKLFCLQQQGLSGLPHVIRRDNGSEVCRFSVCHDDHSLRVDAQVSGDSFFLRDGAEPYNQDSIEIRLDGRDERSRFHSDGEVEFEDIFVAILSPASSPASGANVWRPASLPVGTSCRCMLNEQGYMAELLVPVAWLFSAQTEWTSFRLNIEVNEWHDDSRSVHSWQPSWRSEQNAPWSGTFFRA